MTKIDDEIMNALHYDDNAWLKKIVKFGKLRIEPSGFIGKRRNADLLITILNYHGNQTQQVAIEVENDRKFDVDAILIKIKKDQPCPTIVVIPKEHEKDAWRFQDNLITVWLWRAECKWKCQLCEKMFTTDSSKTPRTCKKCKKRTNLFDFEGADSKKIEFEEVNENPSMTYAEIQKKLNGASVDAWVLG